MRSKDKDSNDLAKYLLGAFWSSEIPKLYSKLFNEEPLLLLEICTMRYQEPTFDMNYVPWHLDANFYGFDVPLLTVWAPLVDVGRHAAGLEFCIPVGDAPAASAIERFWRDRRADELGRTVLSDEELGGFFDGHAWQVTSEELAPGDAFVFDQYALHRTQILPTAHASRLAIEFRVASRSRFPRDANYAEKGRFAVAYKTGGKSIAVSRLDEVLQPPAGLHAGIDSV